MDKILFLKEADRMAASGTNAGTREYVYKKAAPVTGTKPKRDEAGFIVPYAMFHPIREPGLLCELLGDNPVRRCADLKMNLDFLMKEAYLCKKTGSGGRSMRYTGRRNQHESRHGAEVWNPGVAIGSDCRKGHGDV